VDIVRTVVDLRRAVAALRADGRRVALVPTMGALHAGHLSLLDLAGRDGHAVVMSLFVNPTQFGEGEDLSRYPRDEARDVALAAERGVALLFAPGAVEIYPPGFATTVTVDGPAHGLEGAARPGHFTGVATVVAKLLLAARPDRAVFGQKDAQQAAVIRRMARDLHLDDVELVLGPTVREPDGLALSSRNAYLGPDDRAAATALSRGLFAAAGRVAEGERDGAAVEAAARAVIEAEPRIALEYVRAVDPDTFDPLATLDGPALLSAAARVGPARLIDNVPLLPDAARRANGTPTTRQVEAPAAPVLDAVSPIPER
jgi:pantoate--beta-alanine ligase